jgi:hypothetical protein
MYKYKEIEEELIFVRKVILKLLKTHKNFLTINLE